MKEFGELFSVQSVTYYVSFIFTFQGENGQHLGSSEYVIDEGKNLGVENLVFNSLILLCLIIY